MKFCNKWLPVKQECFKLHPELLEQERNNKATRAQEEQVPLQHTLSTLDGKSTKCTGMLIIGATVLAGEDLHISQDSDDSLNAIEMSTAIKTNCQLTPLTQPIFALQLKANHKLQSRFHLQIWERCLYCGIFHFQKTVFSNHHWKLIVS